MKIQLRSAVVLGALFFGIAPYGYLALAWDARRHGVLDPDEFQHSISVLYNCMEPGLTLLRLTPWDHRALFSTGSVLARDLPRFWVSNSLAWWILLSVAALGATALVRRLNRQLRQGRSKANAKERPERKPRKPNALPSTLHSALYTATCLFLAAAVLGLITPGYRELLVWSLTWEAVSPDTYYFWDQVIGISMLPGLFLLEWTPYSGALAPHHQGFREDFRFLLLANWTGWFLVLGAASLTARALIKRLRPKPGSR